MTDKTEALPKEKCYACKYRGTLPGDCHSCCKHPVAEKLNIMANESGIRGGWFTCPANLDTIWLISCDGFKSKGKTDA